MNLSKAADLRHRTAQGAAGSWDNSGSETSQGDDPKHGLYRGPIPAIAVPAIGRTQSCLLLTLWSHSGPRAEGPPEGRGSWLSPGTAICSLRTRNV